MSEKLGGRRRAWRVKPPARFPADHKCSASYLPQPSCNSMATEKSYASGRPACNSPAALLPRARTHEHAGRVRAPTTGEGLTKGVFGLSFCAINPPRCALPSPGLLPAPLPLARSRTRPSVRGPTRRRATLGCAHDEDTPGTRTARAHWAVAAGAHRVVCGPW